ncbi:methyltransferase domain-containing protein [Alteromonas sp. 345S023]|uniref:tRNA 5-carboxymethoxyuridine methyltransferase n=1 Tax=Alteromonas profundi TaxID=2696062 RepID=A0A7X5LPL7_9ALTE|nr:methyltransferase [Alteromonas profundi]NDV92719.1 methyltransferase domain-containing protein [Alteromonas profundi]
MEKDRLFNGIATKFADNIYGTTKGKLRHLILCDVLTPYVSKPLSILEVGGGTGIMAAHLAQQGHTVMLTDASQDVLTLATENLAGFSNVTIKQQYLQDIKDIKNYDLVVCHAVLEWLDKPFEAIDFLFENLNQGSRLSLSFFNKDAALMANAIYGNFEYIERGLKVKNQVKLNPHQALPAKQVVDYCTDKGFRILGKTGVRCFHDYMKVNEHQTSKFEQLLRTERQYNQVEPFLWLGKYFHLMLEKP